MDANTIPEPFRDAVEKIREEFAKLPPPNCDEKITDKTASWHIYNKTSWKG